MTKKTPVFYQLTTDEFLRVNGLLKDSELRVWLYVSTILPFETSEADLSTDEMANLLGLSQRTIQRAINRLTQLELFNIEVLKAKVRRQITPNIASEGGDNLRQPSDKSLQSGDISRHLSDKSRHLMAQDVASEVCNAYTEEPLDLSRSNKIIQIKDVCRLRAENSENTHTGFGKISEPEPEATAVLTQPQIINIEPVPTIQSFGEDQSSGGRLAKKTTLRQGSVTPKYDPALGMRPPTPKVTNLIPDGDWLTESGQLDPAFIRHVAKQWMDSPQASFHKMPVEEVEGLVFAHFAKRENHPNLVVKWESYSKVALRHAQGVKLRLDAEISIPESEQQQIVNQGRAIASALNQPEEEKAVPSLPTQEDRKPFGFVLPPTAESTPQLPQAPKPVEVPLDDFGHAENPNAYKPYEVADITPEEQAANLGKLGALIRTNLKFGLKDKSTHSKKRAIATAAFPSNLSEANDWLSDPCLRSQAVLWAKRECYVVHYTPEGTAFEIENPEF